MGWTWASFELGRTASAEQQVTSRRSHTEIGESKAAIPEGAGRCGRDCVQVDGSHLCGIVYIKQAVQGPSMMENSNVDRPIQPRSICFAVSPLRQPSARRVYKIMKQKVRMAGITIETWGIARPAWLMPGSKASGTRPNTSFAPVTLQLTLRLGADPAPPAIVISGID